MDGEDTLDRKLCSTVALKLLLLLLPKELGKERHQLLTPPDEGYKYK